ncbi:MAG: holo-ACP synthase [Bacteroidia bacterium]|jgi:holo-[acyl-carrier protein] synthase
MILGLGTDIAEVARIAKSVEDIRFKERVFSPAEIAYCESRAHKNESFAARFAAKEAFFKALGTGWRGGLAFNEVEIQNDDLGKPTLHLTGTTAEILIEKKIKSIHVSLSHTKETAIATVIIEG